MNYALSNDDIMHLLNNKVKILRYRDLAAFSSLAELLQPYGRVLVLFETRAGYGHWTLLHRIGKKKVEWFDSYGMFPSDELNYISSSYRKQSNQLREHLTYLLLNSTDKLSYNDHLFQGKGSATCGRWCVLRAVNFTKGIDAFYKAVLKEAKRKRLSPDELVCEMITV